MSHQNLHDLLVEELQDMYDAEHQITKALPKMKEAATSSELKQAFQAHLEQTEQHISRLEDVFALLGESAERKTCKAMKGLIAEGEDLIKDNHASAVLDAALIGGAQRVEHYEIASYGTNCAYAEALGYQDVADILQQTLDDEKETDVLLTEIGIEINQQSAQELEGSQAGRSENRKN